MRFDSKIAIVVRGDLAAWQRLDVTAFLASGIAAGCGEIIGKPCEDGSGHRYLEMFRQPVLVYAADGPALGVVRERAVVRAVPAGELRLAGVAVYRPAQRGGQGLQGPGAALLAAGRTAVSPDEAQGTVPGAFIAG